MPLSVKRDELMTRLKALARVIGRKKPGSILVRGEPGSLMITWGDTTLEVPAKGTWKGIAKIPGSSVRFFSAMMPRGEVVQIRGEPGRLCVDEDSVPCEWVEATPAEDVPQDDLFVLSEEDWEFVRAMRSFLWKVLRSPGITPSAVMGLARALRGLELLPKSTPELEIQVDVFGGGAGRGISFEMEGGRLRVSSSGSIDLVGAGGDSFTAYDRTWYPWTPSEGDPEVEGDVMGMPSSTFLSDVAKLDLASGKWSIEVTDKSVPGALDPSSE